MDAAPRALGPTAPSAHPPGAMRLFGNRNYVLHLIGAALTGFGDYFTLIAMPWLVLTLTRDPLALGVVMALEGLPRAVFMLLGGGMIDRHTPLRALLVSRSVFMSALVLLCVLLWTGRLQIEWLYGLSLVFGLCAAFAMPASSALLPQLVERGMLQKANSALMGAQRLVQLLSPILAGLLIWKVATPVYAGATTIGAQGADASRIAMAFAANAVAAFLALLVQLNIRMTPATDASGQRPPTARLAEGFAHVRRDPGMTIAIAYVACVCFFAIGPLLTAIPQFAQQRLAEGALGYGVLYAANGLGAVLGFAAAGLLPKPTPARIGPTVLATDLLGGLCVLSFAHAQGLALSALALALLGMGTSYGGVVAVSWIQQRVPMALVGRIMSIVMFSSMGLAPLSMVLAGALAARTSLQTMMTVSGVAIVAVSLFGMMTPVIRRFALQPAPPG